MKSALSAVLIASCGMFSLNPTVHAQSASGTRPATVPAPFLGGVPSGVATPDELPLTIIDAIDRALRHNLGVLNAQESANRMQGARRSALAELLPDIRGRIAITIREATESPVDMGPDDGPGSAKVLESLQAQPSRTARQLRLPQPLHDKLQVWRGDAIALASTVPHRLFNLGDEPVHAIWFVHGRRPVDAGAPVIDDGAVEDAALP